MPKWFHFPSPPPTDNKTWSKNLIKIIGAITEIPPRCLTPPEFAFDLTSKATKENYLIHEKIQGKSHSFVGGTA